MYFLFTSLSLFFTYIGAGALDNSLETIEIMQREGIAPDVITYTSLIKACAINGGAGTIDLAEEIFAAMQQRTNHFSSYVEPTVLTFQRLIQAHMRGVKGPSSVNTKRIWELIDDMKFRNIPISLPIYRYMVRAAMLENNITKAMSIIDHMPTKEKAW